MQAEVRKRLLADYHRRFELYKSQHPDKSDVEIDIALLRLQKTAQLDKQKNFYSKSARFYNRSRFKQLTF